MNMVSDLVTIASFIVWLIAFIALLMIQSNTGKMARYLHEQNFLLKLRLKQVDPTLQLPGDKPK